MNKFEKIKVDEYKVLAHELLELADLWNRAGWWNKGQIASAIARKVWYRSAEIQSALMYHKTGMAAINRAPSFPSHEQTGSDHD